MAAPNNTNGIVIGKFAIHHLRPTGVVIEMSGDKRNINVARLANGFAIIERFKNCE